MAKRGSKGSTYAERKRQMILVLKEIYRATGKAPAREDIAEKMGVSGDMVGHLIKRMAHEGIIENIGWQVARRKAAKSAKGEAAR